jgi:hypothetical protein
MLIYDNTAALKLETNYAKESSSKALKIARAFISPAKYFSATARSGCVFK